MPDNIERLREAGYMINTPMPDEYESVLQDLSEAEMDALTQMDALISLMQRLEQARTARGGEAHEWTMYILPP